MDYKVIIEELKTANKKLESELETLRARVQEKNPLDLFKQGDLFEKFAEMIPEMIYEADLSGNISYGNQRGLDFFGYTKNDLARGINISELFPEDCQTMFSNLRALTSPDQTSSNEYLAKKKDGTSVHIKTHSFASFHDGRIIGYRGVVTDISKQKEYENEIKREKVFLEHLYNYTPAAIAITNSSGIISMINREFTTLFGFTPEESVNRKINDLIVPEDLKDEAVMIDKLAELNAKEARQTTRKDKAGKIIHVSLIATSIVINKVNAAHVCIYRDITSERKNMLLQEILYNISSAALKQYDIKEIYPIIVHELNNI
jgi:PAS domain S-box-containing protein